MGVFQVSLKIKGSIDKSQINEKPEYSWTKLNADRSITGGRNNLKASFGGIFRDYKGDPICAYVSKVLHPQDVHNIFVVDLWGIWGGLKLALELGNKSIWIEFDSLSAVKTINGEQQSHNPRVKCGLVWIWELLNKFDNCIISHTWRETNRAADYLTKIDL
ncbi:uncharacterized protein LOC114256194 [Camellia sinensis]|uniref:uncharacterized protein LOC114256194 n=1 Tax=Camellia sinensis TaxID=4442 RepID=UPI0010366373|nr:uncharacterized protein LOC114256194 [Camellia sinensis]